MDPGHAKLGFAETEHTLVCDDRVAQCYDVTGADVEGFGGAPGYHDPRRLTVEAAFLYGRKPQAALEVHDLQQHLERLVVAVGDQTAHPQHRLGVGGSRRIEHSPDYLRFLRIDCVQGDFDPVRRGAGGLGSDTVYGIYERVEHPHDSDHDSDDGADRQGGQQRALGRSGHVPERYLYQRSSRYAQGGQQPRHSSRPLGEMSGPYRVRGRDPDAAPHGYRGCQERH